MRTFKSYIIIFFAVLAAAMTGCKSDDPVPGLVEQSEIELLRANTFREIPTAGQGMWTVTEYPEWAMPMEMTGKAGEAVKLFVESNIGDNDRTATLKISYTDGTESVFTLTQHGAVSDSDNGSETLSNTDLKESYGVGFSVNVFLSSGTSKYFVNTNTPINFSKLKAALDTANESDALSKEDRYFSRIESVTGSTISAIANQLSINAGLEVGISGFKGNIEGGYKSKTSSSEKYEYALEEVQHIVGSCQLRAGMLKYFVDNNINIFQSDFHDTCEEFKDNLENENLMHYIVSTYGTHIITQGSIGGELKLSMQMKVSENVSNSDIHAAIELGTEVVNGGAGVDMSEKKQNIAQNTSITLVTYGGSNEFKITPGANFVEFQNELKNQNNLNKWVENIRNGSSVALIDVELYPIYELMPTPQTREALRNYIVGKYQKSIYTANGKTFTGPDLYVLTGFHHDVNESRLSTVNIPELDMEIVACRVQMPELSKSEYSTVIYSGKKGKVDMSRGFFVGSSTRKPCKFKRDRNGKFTVEEFGVLSAGAITELYVDATGDVTIYPKNSTNLYRSISFPNWNSWDYEHLDLSKVTSDNIVISKPMTLVGKSNREFLRITLKPNVKVKLSNACLGTEESCGGMIVCEGNATLQVAANTKNIINGGRLSDDPAIQIGPAGTQFKIEGTGSLNVLGSAAGIGTGSHLLQQTYGDIIINDVKLTVTAEYGPAIGPGSHSSMSSIKIMSGEIYARSMNSYNCSAAIGTGWGSQCGNILIYHRIKSLTAVAGNDALNIIGQGHEDSLCGLVDLDDPSKVTQKRM